MKITFLGAVEEVTGSKYLIENEETKILVDCGMFQGIKETRTRNWEKFPIDPSSIDAIVLTHAHIDHSGYIPALVKNGFNGKIYCSAPTFALCSILLVDSGELQEEDAKDANQHGYSKHKPALPLYTGNDAKHSLEHFKVINYDATFNIGSLKITLMSAGHIPGASFVIVSDGKKILTFSGDLGRPNQPVMKAPQHLNKTDYLVLESTYGNKLHDKIDYIQALGEIINKTVERGGSIIIPAFAVGRTQMILYCLYQLKQKKSIPDVPIFLDSPMAINVTDLLCQFKDEHKLSTKECIGVGDVATYTQSVEESKRINSIKDPVIIISASGMLNGGRVLHHVKRLISDSKNTILFVGFQAEGTKGRELVDGAKKIEIHGNVYSVHAEIKEMDAFSSHADYNEILEWLGYFESQPKKVFITHGELEAALSLKKKIEEQFEWSVVVPKYKQSFELE
jgi:metallo-beta-lactamase family protein